MSFFVPTDGSFIESMFHKVRFKWDLVTTPVYLKCLYFKFPFEFLEVGSWMFVRQLWFYNFEDLKASLINSTKNVYYAYF